MANVLPLDVKLMDLLQVLSARYPTDADIGDAYQLAGQLSCSEESLAAWKREQLAIEAEWDAQAVAKLCNVPLGQSIRPAIAPTLIALKKRVAELEAKVAAQHLDLREVEKLLNAVHTVRKAVEVQSGRKMGENETFEDFVITHLGGVQLKADVASKMMDAIEAMRVSGGSAEFQLAYQRALGLLKGGE